MKSIQIVVFQQRVKTPWTKLMPLQPSLEKKEGTDLS